MPGVSDTSPQHRDHPAGPGVRPSCHAAVLDRPLSLDDAYGRVRLDEVGGIALFVGVVRDVDPDDTGDRPVDRGVTGLDYQAHPTAERRLTEVAEAVAGRHPVLAVAVEHRTGALTVGDIAVTVAVGARHRAAAFACCRELIDTLKAEVPIWKEQHYVDGSVDWVGAP